MSDSIFISYRRDDSEGEAGRLYDDLIRIFGAGMVFMDVSDIHPGKDFRRAIDDNVSKCTVLLAIIGPGWTTIKDASGTRRLDQPNDFVRLEIASALARNIDVIPVLVHGARMPASADLPENLQDLAYRNCVEITHARWNSDVEAFSRTLRQYVAQGDALQTQLIRKAIRGERMPEATQPREAAEAPRPPKPPLSFVRILVAGLVLVVAAMAGASAYVYIHRLLKHHDQGNARASEQTHDRGQSSNSGGAPGSSPSGSPPQAAQTGAVSATPVANNKAAPGTPSTTSAVRDPLVGTWGASQWRSAARASIPIGTPVEFMVAQHEDQFSVDMFANVGNAIMWCGKQSAAPTSHGLSMVWDEAASPLCGKYPGMYTVNVRLYMIGDRMHMIASGKGMSTGMDFDRIQ